MSTWEPQDPRLWASVTKGYGDGWWDKTVQEINEVEDKRAGEGLCVFCGKFLSQCDEVVAPLPPRPWAGPFCSVECANDHLWFYCMREGK